MLRSQLALRLVFAAVAGLVAAQISDRARTTSAAATAPPRRSLHGITVEIADRISADNLSLVAAGIAFYAFLALFPATAALVAVYGLVADPHAIEGSELAALLPTSAADLLLGVVKSIADKPRGQLSLTFGISMLIALWSARAGVTSLMSGLDIAYRNRKVRSLVAQTGVGLALTLGGILVSAILVAGIAGLPALYAAAPAVLERAAAPWIAWLRWPIVAAEMSITLAILYRFAPSAPPKRWRLFSIGSIVATGLWLVSSCAFSLYVSWSNSYDATYGSLAGVVVMMLWLWASSLSILVGATVDAVLVEQAGHP
jgi:membrane protein